MTFQPWQTEFHVQMLRLSLHCTIWRISRICQQDCYTSSTISISASLAPCLVSKLSIVLQRAHQNWKLLKRASKLLQKTLKRLIIQNKLLLNVGPQTPHNPKCSGSRVWTAVLSSALVATSRVCPYWSAASFSVLQGLELKA